MSLPILANPAAASSSAAVLRDARSAAPAEQIVYKNLHQYRTQQLELGMPTDMLTDSQWGLCLLDKCHHISTTTTTSAATGMLTIQSYRVRICKTCCQEANHIELGTYMDQESAILVNDVFELLNQRYDKLIVLRAEDVSTLHLLAARKYDRTKGKDYCSILELLAERLQGNVDQSGKKRKSPSSTSSSGFLSPGSEANSKTALSETASLTSEETNSNPPKTELQLGSSQQGSDKKRVRHSPLAPESFVTTSLADEEEEYDDEEEEDEDVASADVEPAAVKPVIRVAKVAPPSPTRSPFMRQRSYTFSTAADFTASSFHRNGMDTLAWFATLADDEVAVAKSLFELGSTKKADRSEEFLQSLSNGGAGNTAAAASSSGSYLASGFSYLSPKRVRDEANPDFIDPYQSNQYLTSYPSFYPSEQRKQPSFAAGATSSGEDKLRLLSSAGLLMGDMSGIVLNSPLREIRPGKFSFAPPNHHDDEDDDDHHFLMPMLPASHRRPRSQSMSVIEGSISSFANVNRGKDPLSVALRKYIERGGIPGEGYIGIYSPEDRKLRIDRFLEKRKHRMWTKKVKYDVRKNFADSRIRIKGRFVKKDEEKAFLSQAPNSASKDLSAETRDEDEDEDDYDEEDDEDEPEQKAPKKSTAATPSSSAKKGTNPKAVKKEAVPPAIATPITTVSSAGKPPAGSGKGKRNQAAAADAMASSVSTPQATQSPASTKGRKASSGKK